MKNEPRVVLLADDDLDDQELFKEAAALVDPAVEVHVAFTGKELFEYLRLCPDGHLPSLIILDYNIPDINGALVLEKLSGDPSFRHIPAVIWSTSNAQLYRELCKKNGAREYFVKPSRVSDAILMCQRMLEFS